jgi:hypothetical protein
LPVAVALGIRVAGFGLLTALGEFSTPGTDDPRARALDVLSAARRMLYAILAVVS